MKAKDKIIKDILATHGYTVEEAESILNNAGRAIYQAGYYKCIDDLRICGKPSSRNGKP